MAYYHWSPSPSSWEQDSMEPVAPGGLIWTLPTPLPPSQPVVQSQLHEWQYPAGGYSTAAELGGSNSNIPAYGPADVHHLELGHYVCLHPEGCVQTFDHLQDLHQHLNKPHFPPQELLHCEFCPETFEYEDDLSWHIDTYHPPLFHCKQCPNTTFRLEKDLKRHTLTIHLPHKDPDKRPFRCICGSKTHRRDNHWRHLKTCIQEDGDFFTCDKGHQYSSKTEYRDHLKDVENGCGKPRGRPVLFVDRG